MEINKSPFYWLFRRDPGVVDFVISTLYSAIESNPDLPAQLDKAILRSMAQIALESHDDLYHRNKCVSSIVLTQNTQPGDDFYIGLLQYRSGNFISAINSFKKAASRGHVLATNAVGIVYRDHPEEFRLSLEQTRQMSLIWFKRASRLGSRSALRNVSNLTESLEDTLRYQNITNSMDIFSKIETLAEIDSSGIENVREVQTLCNLKLFQHSQLDALPKLHSVYPEAESLYKKIRETNSNPLKPTRVTSYNPSIPLLTPPSSINLLPFVNTFQLMKTTRNLIHHQKTSDVVFIDSESHFLTIGKSSPLSIPSEPKKKWKMPIRYPQLSEFDKIIQLFELCSAEDSDRNLSLAKILLTQIKPPFTSSLFKNRLEGTGKDKLACGFIYYLAGRLEDSQRVFNDASREGEMMANVMLGIIETHYLPSNHSTRVYFERSISNVISVVYMHEMFNSNLIETVILNTFESKPHLLQERVGDLFYDGVLVPRDLTLAKLWWSRSLRSSGTKSIESKMVLKKLSEVSDIVPEMNERPIRLFNLQG